jgi:hypothetical protein
MEAILDESGRLEPKHSADGAVGEGGRHNIGRKTLREEHASEKNVHRSFRAGAIAKRTFE